MIRRLAISSAGDMLSMMSLPSRWSASCCQTRARSSGRLDADGLTVQVEGFHDGPHRPTHGDVDARKRKATLLAEFAAGQLNEPWVDVYRVALRLLGRVADKKPDAPPDLGAANPTPLASCMSWSMRAASAFTPSSILHRGG